MLWFYARPWFWLRPQGWDREVAESVVRFGAPTMGSGLLKYFASQWDTWFVGRALGVTAVSFYSRSFDLTTRVSDMLSNTLFGQVLFPSYAKLQDDRPRLTRVYLKSTSLVLMLMIPVSLGLLVTAPLLVPVLLGEQWRPMIAVWQIFCVYGLTRPISTNSSPLFLAVGKPRNNVSASLVVIAVMVPLVILLIEALSGGSRRWRWRPRRLRPASLPASCRSNASCRTGRCVTVLGALPYVPCGGIGCLTP